MIDFLGIGAQKCGTTWLYRRLRTHPQVRFPAGKEVHFWDEQRERGVDWWLQPFHRPLTGRERLARLLALDFRPLRCGEITPAYAILGADVVREIHALLPALRLFYIIRNPIERAWSQVRHEYRLAARDVADATEDELIAFVDAPRCRQRGDYLACLDTWLSAFPPAQLHLMVLDDVVAAPKAELVALARFLEIDTTPFLGADESLLGIPENARPTRAVPAALLDHLRETYRPSIAGIGRRLGRRFDGWLAWDGDAGAPRSDAPVKAREAP
jgi:hypothetical protein